MFRFFAHLAVARPVLTSMLVAVFVFLGAFSYLAIPLDPPHIPLHSRQFVRLWFSLEMRPRKCETHRFPSVRA